MKKIVLTTILILSVLFSLFGCSSQNTTPTTSSVETSKEKTELLFFQYDDVVNNFFEKYNLISDRPIKSTEIKKGNINTKALVYIDDFSMEILNTKQNSLIISISDDYKNENTNLHNVFVNCIKAMYSDLNSDEIENAWNEIHSTGYQVENYDFNDIQITYVPYKELSSGHSDLRIDLTFSIEN